MDDHASLMNDYHAGTLKYSVLKDAVGDGLVAISSELRANRDELNSDKKAVKNMIKQSSYEIRKRAQQTLKDVRSITGLMSLRY
jgi:tryptophanyl-tRNA synthetase